MMKLLHNNDNDYDPRPRGVRLNEEAIAGGAVIAGLIAVGFVVVGVVCVVAAIYLL